MCADPKLRGALMQELRDELAARRRFRAQRGERKSPTSVLVYGAPAAAALLLAILVL